MTDEAAGKAVLLITLAVYGLRPVGCLSRGWMKHGGLNSGVIMPRVEKEGQSIDEIGVGFNDMSDIFEELMPQLLTELS